MTLREFCIKADCEVEVWDKEIDLGAPYYNYYGENTYKDNEEEHFLFLLENWILSLPVTEFIGETCVSVDVFSAVQNIIACNDDTVADYVEDIFTTLAYGDYSFAKRFCEIMFTSVDKEMIIKRFYDKKINVVTIDHYPDCDKIDFEEIDELKKDLSQGTGNVVIRYLYVPALDILCAYCDY